MKSQSQMFLDGLVAELVQLPAANQMAFGASCCERALPNYRLFSETEKWGDCGVLRAGLDCVWAFIQGGSVAPDEALVLETQCKAVTPHSDDFASDHAEAGEEAAFMVTLLLQWLRDKQTKYAVRIATFARDTIDSHVQRVEGMAANDPDLDAKIDAHPLMRTELDKQKLDTKVLRTIRTTQELTAFRKAAAAGKSNIGL